MKENTVLLSLAHIEDMSESLQYPMDDYLRSFKDELRRKESILARIELNRLCHIFFYTSLEKMNFHKSPEGKPLLSSGYCSISHCKGLVFVAVSNNAIGVDIERFEQEELSALEIAFRPFEWEEIKNDDKEIVRRFSQKEALSKLRGTGFLQDPIHIEQSYQEKTIQYNLKTGENENFVLTVCTSENTLIEFENSNKFRTFVRHYEH